MFKRIVLLISLTALLLGAGIAFAQDSDIITIPTQNYGNIAYINDGRLNGADVAAPVAIYYKYDTVQLANGKWNKVMTALDLLSIDPKTNNGTLALEITAPDLIKMIDTGEHKDGLLLGQNNGFNLYYSDDNWFWVTAPADKEGKVYSFKWQNFTVQHD